MPLLSIFAALFFSVLCFWCFLECCFAGFFLDFGRSESCFLVILEAWRPILEARGPILRIFGIVVILGALPVRKGPPFGGHFGPQNGAKTLPRSIKKLIMILMSLGIGFDRICGGFGVPNWSQVGSEMELKRGSRDDSETERF